MNNLAKCDDCGGVVSKRANICPHCGCPFVDAPGTIVIKGASLPFEDIVALMIKTTFAAIPAAIIIAVIVWGAVAVFAGIGAAIR